MAEEGTMRYLVVLVLLVGLGLASGVTAFGQQEPSLTPLIRGMASFVLPGFGQYLNGEYDKALTHFLVMVVLDVGTWYVANLLPYYPAYLITGGVHTLWALYSAVDAYQTALELEGLSLELSPNGFALNF